MVNDRSKDENRKATPRLLTPAEAARMFSVDVKTVQRWHDKGHITAVRTLGGQRRYHADDLHALREKLTGESSENG